MVFLVGHVLTDIEDYGDLKKIILHKSFYNWILTQLKLILIQEDYDLLLHFENDFLSSHDYLIRVNNFCILNSKCSLYGNSIGLLYIARDLPHHLTS